MSRDGAMTRPVERAESDMTCPRCGDLTSVPVSQTVAHCASCFALLTSRACDLRPDGER